MRLTGQGRDAKVLDVRVRDAGAADGQTKCIGAWPRIGQDQMGQTSRIRCDLACCHGLPVFVSVGTVLQYIGLTLHEQGQFHVIAVLGQDLPRTRLGDFA